MHFGGIPGAFQGDSRCISGEFQVHFRGISGEFETPFAQLNVHCPGPDNTIGKGKRSDLKLVLLAHIKYILDLLGFQLCQK